MVKVFIPASSSSYGIGTDDVNLFLLTKCCGTEMLDIATCSKCGTKDREVSNKFSHSFPIDQPYWKSVGEGATENEIATWVSHYTGIPESELKVTYKL